MPVQICLSCYSEHKRRPFRSLRAHLGTNLILCGLCIAGLKPLIQLTDEYPRFVDALHANGTDLSIFIDYMLREMVRAGLYNPSQVAPYINELHIVDMVHTITPTTIHERNFSSSKNNQWFRI